MNGQNVAVRLTGAGRGAVATVLVAGPESTHHVDHFFTAAAHIEAQQFHINRTYFGNWQWEDYREELVVCRVASDRFEVHCHGGRLAAQSILDALATRDVLSVSMPAWLEIAEPDLFVRDAKRLLLEVRTERACKMVLDQIQGAMRRELGEIRQQLAADGRHGMGESDRIQAAQAALQAIVDRAELGLRIAKPWHVALVGSPNAGKSSLINALVGYDRSVVYDQPGTTRDLVSAEAAIDGWPLVLTDTAGVRDSTDPIEAAGIDLARQTMSQANLVLWLQDMSVPPTSQSDPLASLLTGVPTLRVGTKSDLVSPSAQPGTTNQKSPAHDIVTSVITGDGIQELWSQVSKALVPNPPEPGAAVPLSPAQVSLLNSVLDRLNAGDFDGALEALDA